MVVSYRSIFLWYFFVETMLLMLAASSFQDGAVEAGERASRNVLVSMGLLDQSHYDAISYPPVSDQMPFVDLKPSALESLLPSVGTIYGVSAALVTAAAAIFLRKVFG